MNYQKYFDDMYEKYSDESFIGEDPIQIPYLFKVKQDIEIAGFFAAIFAWGRRQMIIKKSQDLMEIMGHQPYLFVQNYSANDVDKISNFKHRTFNASDLDFYIRALQAHYKKYSSLEDAFLPAVQSDTIENNLSHFYQYLLNLVPHEARNLKHISSPLKNSACKRLCMYLRWMVRKEGVDFGVWSRISPHQLIIPLDIHVLNVSLKLNLIDQKDKSSWKTAIKITNKLKEYNESDPVKYDFVLFGLGNSKVI